MFKGSRRTENGAWERIQSYTEGFYYVIFERRQAKLWARMNMPKIEGKEEEKKTDCALGREAK